MPGRKKQRLKTLSVKEQRARFYQTVQHCFLTFCDYALDGKDTEAINFFQKPTERKESEFPDEELEDDVDLSGFKLVEIENMVRNSGGLKQLYYPQILQVYMLIWVNDEKKNVLHIACKNGSYSLCRFLLDQAGCNNFDILKHIIHQKDELGLTPLFHLCQRGYMGRLPKNGPPASHANRYKIIEMMVGGLDKKVFKSFSAKEIKLKENLELETNLASWGESCTQIKYTPLHWLCYWNDHESIKILLQRYLLSFQSGRTNLPDLMAEDAAGMTPLDIAGQHGSKESAILILTFFSGNFRFVHEVFKPELYDSSEEGEDDGHLNKVAVEPSSARKKEGMYDIVQIWRIFYTHHSELNTKQKLWAKLYFWAGYFGRVKLVDKFLSIIGISPFMKIYNCQSVVHACIRGQQFEMLEYLAKDTNKGVRRRQRPHIKYQVQLQDNVSRFYKSRQAKDRQGNNACHFAFQIEDQEVRKQFLDLLLKEEIGDPSKRNMLGLLPHEIQHNFDFEKEISEDYLKVFRETELEQDEADYLIVTSCTPTSKGKTELITSQLDQLDLKKGTDYVVLTKPGQKGMKEIYISIKFPDRILNKAAVQIGSPCSLTNLTADYFVKSEFHPRHSAKFNQFDSTERIGTIEEFLEEEIDFDYMIKCGIIEAHFPLHKRNSTHEIRRILLKYKPRLLRGFMFGSYKKYMYPLNAMKNYYGEKYAFEYAFLLHYQSWLYIPALLGLALFAYQIWRYLDLGDYKAALDSEWNGVFGLVVALWATCFVESWKRKQKAIQFIWNCSDKSFSKVDEREDDFKFFEYYNPVTDKIQKEGKKVSPGLARCQRFSMYFLLLVCIATMVVYRSVLLTTKGEYNDDGSIKVPRTMNDRIMGYVYSFIYSFVVIIFGQCYKKLAYIQTSDENHRYQNHFDNALITRFFLFNSFNYYFPLLFIAVDSRNKRSYDDIFYLMLSQMAFKQILLNFIEYWLPIIKVRGPLMALKKAYSDLFDTRKSLAQIPFLFKDKQSVMPTEHNTKSDANLLDVEEEKKAKKSEYKIRPMREFQALRDMLLIKDKPDILYHYMELVVQFGYIILFSAVFPLAGLMSLFSNTFQINSQINNFKYIRRFKPEVSNGIGNWLTCLQTLSQLSIITNCAQIYFTSKIYRKMFVEEDADEDVVIALTTGWDLTSFFLLVVIVEHIMIILKMFVEQLIDDTPEDVIRGKNERAIQLKDFRKMIKDEGSGGSVIAGGEDASIIISEQQLVSPAAAVEKDLKIGSLGDEPLFVPEKKKQLSKNTIPVDEPAKDLLPQAKTAQQSLDSKMIGLNSALSGFKSSISTQMGKAIKSMVQSSNKKRKLEPQEFEERLQRLRQKSKSSKRRQKERQSQQEKTSAVAVEMFNHFNSQQASVSLPKIHRENPHKKKDFKLFDALVDN